MVSTSVGSWLLQSSHQDDFLWERGRPGLAAWGWRQSTVSRRQSGDPWPFRRGMWRPPFPRWPNWEIGPGALLPPFSTPGPSWLSFGVPPWQALSIVYKVVWVPHFPGGETSGQSGTTTPPRPPAISVLNCQPELLTPRLIYINKRKHMLFGFGLGTVHRMTTGPKAQSTHSSSPAEESPPRCPPPLPPPSSSAFAWRPPQRPVLSGRLGNRKLELVTAAGGMFDAVTMRVGELHAAGGRVLTRIQSAPHPPEIPIS